jgi:hypothetical protein
VQLQRFEVRHAPAREHFERVLFRLGREDDAEARDVFAEEFEHRALQPRLAKTDPRRKAAVSLRGGACVGRVLEERDARLLPEAVAEPQRRVHGRREHGRRYGLRHVVERHEIFRADLQMHLKARVRRQEHDVVGEDADLVEPLDVRADRVAAHPHDGLVQLVVARRGRDLFEADVFAPQRREDARQQHVRPGAARALPHEADDLSHLRLQTPQAVAFEQARREVGFEVEARNLGRQTRVADAPQHLWRDRGGAQVAVYEEHLLLRPNPPHPVLDAPLREHPFERGQVVQQRPHKRPHLPVVADRLYLMFAHDFFFEEFGSVILKWRPLFRVAPGSASTLRTRLWKANCIPTRRPNEEERGAGQ